MTLLAITPLAHYILLPNCVQVTTLPYLYIIIFHIACFTVLGVTHYSCSNWPTNKIPNNVISPKMLSITILSPKMNPGSAKPVSKCVFVDMVMCRCDVTGVTLSTHNHHAAQAKTGLHRYQIDDERNGRASRPSQVSPFILFRGLIVPDLNLQENLCPAPAG